MKANTKKFLTTYNALGKIENLETPIGRVERIQREKEVRLLESDLTKFGAKVTEDQFEFLGDLCINSWEDFMDAYHTL